MQSEAIEVALQQIDQECESSPLTAPTRIVLVGDREGNSKYEAQLKRASREPEWKARFGEHSSWQEQLQNIRGRPACQKLPIFPLLVRDMEAAKSGFAEMAAAFGHGSQYQQLDLDSSPREIADALAIRVLDDIARSEGSAWHYR